MHHGSSEHGLQEVERETIKLSRGKRKLLERLGPTGRFPEGQASPDDEGEIAMGIGRYIDQQDRPRVAIDFGKAVRWVGMNAQQALDLAGMLQKQAREILRQR